MLNTKLNTNSNNSAGANWSAALETMLKLSQATCSSGASGLRIDDENDTSQKLHDVDIESPPGSVNFFVQGPALMSAWKLRMQCLCTGNFSVQIVLKESDFQFKALTDTDLVTVGGTVGVSANVSQPSSHLKHGSNLTIAAIARDQNGNQLLLKLRRSPREPALFVENFTNLTTTGLYTLSLVGTDVLPDPGVLTTTIQANQTRIPFSVEVVDLGFFVTAITAQFSEFGFTEIDHDNDGVLEAMEVIFSVKFSHIEFDDSIQQAPSAFSFSADLYDACGNFVTNSQKEVSIPDWRAGNTSQISLTLSGREIYEGTSCDEKCCHELGAYSIQNVACAGDLPVQQQAGTVLNTRPFDPSEFSHPPLDFLCIDGDEMKDDDNDGLGDAIVVHVKIRISQYYQRYDEDYVVRATLYTVCNLTAHSSCISQQIDTSDDIVMLVTSASLQDASVRRVAINFDGGMLRKFAEEKRAQQQNASTKSNFVLRNLEVWGSKSGKKMIEPFPEGITAEYDMMDFILKRVDVCGEWGGMNRSLGCDGVCFSNLRLDSCGLCGGRDVGLRTCQPRKEWWLWLAVSVVLIFAMLALSHCCYKRVPAIPDEQGDRTDKAESAQPRVKRKDSLKISIIKDSGRTLVELLDTDGVELEEKSISSKDQSKAAPRSMEESSVPELLPGQVEDAQLEGQEGATLESTNEISAGATSESPSPSSRLVLTPYDGGMHRDRPISEHEARGVFSNLIDEADPGGQDPCESRASTGGHAAATRMNLVEEIPSDDETE